MAKQAYQKKRASEQRKRKAKRKTLHHCNNCSKVTLHRWNKVTKRFYCVICS